MAETVLIILATLLAIIFIAANFKRTTVFEYERGLKYSKGKFAGIVAPGRYFHTVKTVIQKLDMRLRSVTVGGQEVLTSDGISLKISLVAQYEIVDANIAINKVLDYQTTLYAELQMVLRELVGKMKIDEILERRQEVATSLMEQAAGRVLAFGLKLIAANIKDIMFPGEFKKIFAQVVKARQEGLVVLEKARCETAALRNLANAAKLIESNPALMQLRLLQTVSEASGNSIILKMSQPIPESAKEAGNNE